MLAFTPPRTAFVSPLLHDFPGGVWVKCANRVRRLSGMIAQVLFVAHSILVHYEGLDAGHAVFHGPRHDSEPSDHQTMLNVVPCAAHGARALRGQNAEAVAMIRHRRRTGYVVPLRGSLIYQACDRTGRSAFGFRPIQS